jgi:hypothetical protein
MLPYASAKMKTIDARKHHIQQKQSGRLGLSVGYDTGRGPKPTGGKSCLL